MARGLSTTARLSRAACCRPASCTSTAGSTSALDRRFQLMETADPNLFDEWVARWRDLAEFEVVPVIDSGEAAARALR
jgi:Protein of unknown function (DUF3303)